MMGTLALQVGKLDPATRLLTEATRLSPRDPHVATNLASALRRSGRTEAALAEIDRALALFPDFGDAIHNRVNILEDMGRHGEAAETMQRLIALRGATVEHQIRLARFLILAERAEEAIEALYDLLGIDPLSTAAYTNLGVAYRRLGRVEEADRAYRTGLGFAPDDNGLLNNHGILLQDAGRVEEAVACFRRAIALQPEAAATHLNLSLAERDLMRIDDAVASARHAIRADPNLPAAHTALAMALLMRGDLREGFAEYEWRSRMADFPSPRRDFAAPRWTGEPLGGRSIVVHDEQGVGDALQFLRYAPMLTARGARVFVECNSQLVRLLQGMEGVAGVIGRFQPLPPHDYQVSLLSLPHLLGTTRDTIPAAVPYLRAEPDLAAEWRGRLAAHPGLRVGLVWAGNPEFKADNLRSPGLAAFRPLLDVTGVTIFGLQKGPGRRDLEGIGALPASFVDLGPDIHDFADTAAIMEGLDLVISSCTGPAHLAGALGCPTWTVLPFSPDWRWFDRGEDTPWYPTMRLFRQDRPREWGPVMTRVGASLSALAGRGQGKA